ncbi:MAG: glycosyltransferase family 2 protein [Acidobacteriota bacterium]
MGLRKVSVVILSWNGRRHLEACLPALREQRDPGVPWEVLVLDNGSTDGTAEWVRAEHPEVRLVVSPRNLGFCSGNNRLVREADGDAVVLLNNDTRPRPDWLATLVDALASAPEDVAAVSGAIVDWGGECLDFARGLLTFDGHAFQLGYGRPLGEVDLPAAGSELLFACGGNMIVRRDAYLAAGGFDDAYFAYLEDVDLGWRLWAMGHRILLAPEAVVHHRSMATSQLLGNDNRGFLFERNAFWTAYKNLDAELWPRLMPAIELTLLHRTQTLLVQNNPGTETFTLDPYAGAIANTGVAGPGSTGNGTGGAVGDGTAFAPSAALAPAAAVPRTSLREKWRGYGPSGFVRRGLRKAARLALPSWVFDDLTPAAPRVVDPRTVSQLRALTYLLGHLDAAADRRRTVQGLRRRPDREIFERFPLAVVPTYPGDEQLFDSAAFEAWLPDDLPFTRLRLDQVMDLDPG